MVDESPAFRELVKTGFPQCAVYTADDLRSAIALIDGHSKDIATVLGQLSDYYFKDCVHLRINSALCCYYS